MLPRPSRPEAQGRWAWVHRPHLCPTHKHALACPLTEYRGLYSTRFLPSPPPPSSSKQVGGGRVVSWCRRLRRFGEPPPHSWGERRLNSRSIRDQEIAYVHARTIHKNTTIINISALKSIHATWNIARQHFPSFRFHTVVLSSIVLLNGNLLALALFSLRERKH